VEAGGLLSNEVDSHNGRGCNGGKRSDAVPGDRLRRGKGQRSVFSSENGWLVRVDEGGVTGIAVGLQGSQGGRE